MKKPLLFIAIAITTNFLSQSTYVPDDNFEQALIDLGYDTALDDYVLTENIENIGELNISSKGIEDLTGLEDFNSLYYLDCFTNNLSHFDFSQNTNLRWVNCSSGSAEYPLLSVDVTECLELEYLICCGSAFIPGEHMESIDLSNNIALREASLTFNQLTSLDLSNNPALEVVNCYGNNLSCLNLRNGNNSNIYSVNFEQNPNLSCIEVDNVAFAEQFWFAIDPQTSFSEDCNNDCSGNSSFLTELSGSPKNLIQILDMMGRETSFKPNVPLIYVYDDGSTQKVFSVE